ncbi:flagellar hook-basal body complex protein FliE [Jeotgalibacillus sp. S-D1]|uniref:flagellar hook-basal body complex protein FliE n=1 Tax=Jeotgalibacillus sp. S-D1 TaxID=2552189 RepID=UPI001F0FA79B|nr:flagellar hook-basal body complex protein FliE [Jeotgalibacillus sp. S-D1]
MPIQSINTTALESFRPSNDQVIKKSSPYEAQQSFAAMLNDSLQTVNDAQVQSDKATEKMIKGEKIDLHDVMITSQKASVSLALTMELRNKAVEAYQEVMRMSV